MICGCPLEQVDCPGHASLIRTIIGGAQIMDMMLLVIDATKGMQAQTVECIVIGEAVMASGADVIVVLNKVNTCRFTELFTGIFFYLCMSRAPVKKDISIKIRHLPTSSHRSVIKQVSFSLFLTAD